MRDGNVAEEGARLGRDDGEVRVVALKGGEEGERDGVGGVEGEGRGGVEVFDGGLRVGPMLIRCNDSLCFSGVFEVLTPGFGEADRGCRLG